MQHKSKGFLGLFKSKTQYAKPEGKQIREGGGRKERGRREGGRDGGREEEEGGEGREEGGREGGREEIHSMPNQKVNKLGSGVVYSVG